MQANARTAIVFAGGGSLGAVQIGMLKALVGAKVPADLLVGSSVGAINAAFFAGVPTSEGIDRLEAIWRGVTRGDIFALAPLRAFLSLVSNEHSIASPHALERLLRRELPYDCLESAEIPLHVIGTRLVDGAEIVLSSGQLVPALMASAAIPGVFPPVKIDGHLVVDGGVASNTPVAAAVKLGASRIIVLPTGSHCAAKRMPRGSIGVAIHALNLLIIRQLIRDLERYMDQLELIVVPPLCPLEVQAYDFSQTAVLIQRAEASTAAWLENHGINPTGIPPELLPHGHPPTVD